MDVTDQFKKIFSSNYTLAEKQKEYTKKLKLLTKAQAKVVKAYKNLAEEERKFLVLEKNTAKLYSDLQDFKNELKNQGVLHFFPEQMEFKKAFSTYHSKISEKRLEIAQIFEKLAILEKRLYESNKKLVKMKEAEVSILKKVAKKEKSCSKLSKKCIDTQNLSEEKVEKLKDNLKKCQLDLEHNETVLKNKRAEIFNFEKEISKIEDNLAVLMKVLSFKYAEGERIRPPE
ncbi:MAG: hypothetical protein P8Y70_02250 [Candidatus Lokiarchaeota archaeon]